MADGQFWLLFIYTSIVFLIGTLRWWNISDYEDYCDTTYYCDEETYDRITGKVFFRVNDNGVLGTAVDSHGQTHYIVLVPKDEFDEAMKEFAETKKE